MSGKKHKRKLKLHKQRLQIPLKSNVLVSNQQESNIVVFILYYADEDPRFWKRGDTGTQTRKNGNGTRIKSRLSINVAP